MRNNVIRNWIVGVVVATPVLLWVAFAVWRTRLSHSVDAKIQAIRAAGLPTSPAELNAWYTNVPDAENAALQVEAAIALLKTYPRSRSNDIDHIKIPKIGKTFSDEDLTLISGYVEMNHDAMAKAASAITLPKSRYPVDLSDGYETKVPHLDGIKTLCQLERYAALLPGTDSHAKARCVETQLGLARTVESEPMHISSLVNIACVNIAWATTERAMSDGALSRADLEVLADEFALRDKAGTLVPGLIGDRAMYIPIFAMTPEEMAHATSDDSSGTRTEDLRKGNGFLQATGFFQRDLDHYLGSMATIIDFAGKAPPASLEVDDFAAKDEETMHHNFYILSTLLLPALRNAVDTDARYLAHVRDTEAAIKVELYREKNGNLPESLAEAGANYTDPFDGKPLRYFKRPERGYLIYSVGPDKSDDHGKEEPTKIIRTIKQEYDLPFVVDR